MLQDFVLKLALKHLEQEALKAYAQKEGFRAAKHALKRELPKAARNIHVTFTPGDIHLDYEELGRILREDCAAPINEIAAKVAANAAANPDLMDDAPGSVEVTAYTTDRAIAVVRINHPAGDALEAKYGILKRAAAAEGLEVKSK